jgi:hypothetical protein
MKKSAAAPKKGTKGPVKMTKPVSPKKAKSTPMKKAQYGGGTGD